MQEGIDVQRDRIADAALDISHIYGGVKHTHTTADRTFFAVDRYPNPLVAEKGFEQTDASS